MKVRADLDNMDTYCNKLDKLIEEFKQKISDYEKFAISKTDMWESKYQRTFDRHIAKEFVPYCKKLASNSEKLNNHLKKSMNDYKRIDSSRM